MVMKTSLLLCVLCDRVVPSVISRRFGSFYAADLGYVSSFVDLKISRMVQLILHCTVTILRSFWGMTAF